MQLVTTSIKGWVERYRWLFAFAPFGVSAMTHSQAATVASSMPLGLAPSIPSLVLIDMLSAAYGYFLDTKYGSAHRWRGLRQPRGDEDRTAAIRPFREGAPS